MKAILVREFGGPEVLRWEEVPTPVPGPDEVLIQVHAVSVNRTLDIQVRQDGGNYGVTLPLVLGVDPSGIVQVCGSWPGRRAAAGQRPCYHEHALRLGKSEELKVLIDRLVPLKEAAVAHRLVAQNEPLGKIILDPHAAS